MTEELFLEELQGIRFRSRLMGLGPDGVNWLVHVSKLFSCREKSLREGEFGLPRGLQKRLTLHDP